MAYLFLTLILKLPRQHARHIYLLWTPSSIPATNVESATHRRPAIKGMCCLRTLGSCDAVFSMFLGKHRPPAPPWLSLMVVLTGISEKCFSSFSGHEHYRGAWGKTDGWALTSRKCKGHSYVRDIQNVRDITFSRCKGEPKHFRFSPAPSSYWCCFPWIALGVILF